MLNEIEIVILTETWLDTKTLSENCTIFGHFEVVTRVDRPGGQHGGVVVLQRKVSNVISKDIIIKLDQFLAPASSWRTHLMPLPSPVFICHREQAITESYQSDLNFSFQTVNSGLTKFTQTLLTSL